MLSQLCSTTIWTHSRKSRVNSKMRNGQKQPCKRNFQIQKSNLKLKIKSGLSSDEESDSLICQPTDNPCYGLAIPCDTNKDIVGKDISRRQPISQTLCKDQETPVVDSKETLQRHSNKKPSSAFSTKQTCSNCPHSVQPMTRNIRKCNHCQRRQRYFDSQQHKALEEIVTLFDHHLNTALSRQYNKLSLDHKRKSVATTTALKQNRKSLVKNGHHFPNGSQNIAAKKDALYANRNVYSVNDIDKLPSSASRDNPANIPMVVMQCCRLKSHIRNEIVIRESSLAMGTIVYAIFREMEWLFIRTPHGKEGYVLQSCCVSMGSLIQKDSNTIRANKLMMKSSNDSTENSKTIICNVLADVNPSCFGNDCKAVDRGPESST